MSWTGQRGPRIECSRFVLDALGCRLCEGSEIFGQGIVGFQGRKVYQSLEKDATAEPWTSV